VWWIKKGICTNWYDIRMVLIEILWQKVNGSRTLAHNIMKEILFNKEMCGMFILCQMNAPSTSELSCERFGNPYCLNLQGVVPHGSCTT
jgi:hypothetical protein